MRQATAAAVSAFALVSTGSAEAASITVSNTSTTPVSAGITLIASHHYRITARGTVSDWCISAGNCPTADPKVAKPNDGVDPLYCYAKWRCPTPELWRQLQINGVGLDQFAGLDGKIPYSGGHSYSVTVTGKSGPVTLGSSDALAGSTGDNSGKFTVVISEVGGGGGGGGSGSPVGSGTTVCVGGCTNFSFDYDPNLAATDTRTDLGMSCGGSPPRVTSSAARPREGGLCSITAVTQIDPQAVQTVATQIQVDNLRQQMDRWKILQDTQTKIFEIQQDVTVNKAKAADKAFQKWDEYIRGGDSTPADATSLKASDGALGSEFPAKSAKVERPPASARVRLVALPDSSLVFQSLYAPNPTPAAIAAFNRELEIATSPAYSTERAIARITLSAAVALGQRVIAFDVSRTGGSGAVTLGTAHSTLAANGSRTSVVATSALGGRIVRLLAVVDLKHPASVSLELSVTRDGKTASVTKPLKIG